MRYDTGCLGRESTPTQVCQFSFDSVAVNNLMRHFDRLYRKFPDACFVVLLAALVTGAFWKLLLPSQFTFLETPDIVNVIVPWLEVQARALRAGDLALWDPFMFGGQPLLGQLQPGVANPLTYVLLALPLKDGQLQIGFIHFWFVFMHVLAAVFAYACCRELRCRPPAAMLGGLFYTLGGYVGNVTTPPYLAGVVWTPLVFLFLFRFLRGARPTGNAALTGLVLGEVWLSGHHQTAYFLTLTVTGVLVWAVIQSGRAWWRMTRLACLCLAIGALTSCVQMLPAIEYGRGAVRWVALPEPVEWGSRVPYEAHQNNSLPASDLIFVALPGSGGTLWCPTVGLVAISLIGLALAATLRTLLTRILTAIALAALLFATARFNPLHGILYLLLPGLDAARSPAVALSVMHFALTPLVALGADRLLNGTLPFAWLRRASKWAVWCAFAIAALVLTEAPLTRKVDHGAERFAMIALVCLLLAGIYAAFANKRVSMGLGTAFLAVLLLLETGTNTGFDYPTIAELRRKNAVLPRLDEMRQLGKFVRSLPDPKRIEIDYQDFLFNFGDWFGVELMSGFVPSAPTSLYRLTWWEPRILSMYGVNYSISSKPPRPGQHEIYAGPRGLRVFANDGVMPRAWSVHTLQAAGGEGARLVREGDFDFRERAVLSGPLPRLEACNGPDSVAVEYKGTRHLRVHAQMQCRGMVIIGDNAFPGWQASVDGHAAMIYAANTSLRGVVVDKGTHDIEMVYRPQSAVWGLVLSLTGVALTLFLRSRSESAGEGILGDSRIIDETS